MNAFEKTQTEILSLASYFNARFTRWMGLGDMLFIPTPVDPMNPDYSIIIERSCDERLIDYLKSVCNKSDGSNHLLCTTNEFISLAYSKCEALIQRFLVALNDLMHGSDNAKSLTLRQIDPKLHNTGALYYAISFYNVDPSAPLGLYYDWAMHTKALMNKYTRRFEIKTE